MPPFLISVTPSVCLSITLFTHDPLNRLQIGFVVNRLESGLIASVFTHSLANRHHNNCDNVGGASYLFLQACGSDPWIFVGKTSSQGELHVDYWSFSLSKQSTFWCSFYSLCTLSVIVFLPNKEFKHPICMHGRIYWECYFPSIVLWFLVYLEDK